MDLLTPELEILGRLPYSSNYTFLATLKGSDERVVYKPRDGESPLWDFPPGSLCQREVAAYLVAEELGWGLVPPTVLRDGPLGIGAVQSFIEHDPSITAFSLGPRHIPELRRVALLDVVINNADRKGGHVILDVDDRVWSVDHGICFHEEPKLRTVIWVFAGEQVTEEEMHDLQGLEGSLGAIGGLAELLSPSELRALEGRLGGLIESGVFPQPGPGRSTPWPPV
ncbi:MAG TPA: SCO1664 family protein [Actinomycetota bacterium]|nr:SCO1664 family protein [Actinomycetota bacterium]